jgi:ribonucleoside-triphosphate reductase
MVRFGAILQGHFAGVVGWDGVNLSFAPYLSKMNDREIRQFAQMLIYEFSQLTSARGGQSMFTDIHLYWNIPGHLLNAPAIGPSGEFTGGGYEDFIGDARRFAWAIFEVFKKGDGTGKPFIFPRPRVHITDMFFQTPGHEEFLNHICEVAVEKGNTCFTFDRYGTTYVCECGISDMKVEDFREEMKTPWKMRCSALQNVTLNLPRLGYKAGGDDGRLMSLIIAKLELIAKAHNQKRDFIQKLMSYGDEGPLAMLAMNRDGLPYLRMDRASYLIGLVGLNELVQIHRGQQLHESEDALSFGLEVITSMKEETERLGGKHGLQFILEQTPAETTPYRFARLDLKYYSPAAGHYVKGNLSRGEVYYTNSTHLAVSADVTPIERVVCEGRFHPLVGGNVMTQIWLGGVLPDKETVARFVVEAFHNAQNNQVVFSPEFTTCRGCGRTSVGLKDVCTFCGSREIEGIARITQYFSKVSGWNKGKLAELRDRNRSIF